MSTYSGKKNFIVKRINFKILSLLLFLILIACVGMISMPDKWHQLPMQSPLPNPNSVSKNNSSPFIPTKLDFAGEEVPLDDPIVFEQLDGELLQNQYFHHATILNIKRSNRYRDTMLSILRKHSVPEDFFYLMVAESGVRNVTSYRGAQGFWQFMEDTGREFGLENNLYVDYRNDPIKSTHAACKYLNQAYKRFKNWTIVAASYNMGMGGISQAMAQQLSNNYHELYLNSETARYVYRILAIKLILQNPVQYGFYLSDRDLYKPLKTRTIQVPGGTSFSSIAKSNNLSYKTVRAYNPWFRKDQLPINKYGLYDIYLPSEN